LPAVCKCQGLQMHVLESAEHKLGGEVASPKGWASAAGGVLEQNSWLTVHLKTLLGKVGILGQGTHTNTQAHPRTDKQMPEPTALNGGASCTHRHQHTCRHHTPPCRQGMRERPPPSATPLMGLRASPHCLTPVPHQAATGIGKSNDVWVHLH